MKILMTGATGLIGKELGKVLVEKGHELLVVTRNKVKAREQLPYPAEILVGDLNNGPLKDERLSSVDAVINLMGESVGVGRWSKHKKEEIYNSRVLGTRHLVQSLVKAPRVFVSGSALGYYGPRGEELLTEDMAPGSDFLSKVTIDWEKEVEAVSSRKAFIRTGIVLSQQGGALEKMLFPFRVGVGGPLGNGQQWMSWIHIKDIVGLFVFALENEKVHGALNGVAPHPVRNREFSETLSLCLGKTMGPPVPAIVLKFMFGEMGSVVLGSQRGSVKKATDLGYRYQYEKLHDALHEICAPYRAGEEIYQVEQYVPESPAALFPFFQDPQNLEKITPESLNFRIQNISSGEIEQGTVIDYKLQIHGVPAKWKAEIDEWQPPFKFVDNQIEGPYKLWRHTHEFHPIGAGTLLVDRVRYKLPMGKLGWLVASHWVRKDVEKIFNFRRRYIVNMKIEKHP